MLLASRILCFSLVLLALAGADARRVLAQHSIDTATVTGTVTDPTGAAVPTATISMRSTDRNQTSATRTSDRGRFTVLYLPPGAYELSVAADGFTPRRLTVTLTLGQALDVPIALALTGLTAEVSVSAVVTGLETRRTQAADTIQPGEVDSLPLNGRNYLDLALLAPGVSRTIQRNTERFAETSAVPGTGISFAGQRNLNNTFIVDGLSGNDDAAGLAGTYFAEDVIREFQVVTSGGIAEFGRSSSGIVSIVTQSGANARRGRAYGFFRNDRLDERNPLATREDPLNQQQYGLTLSGPLVRDRTFWFGNIEQTRLDRTGIITIAPAAVATINTRLSATGYRGPGISTGEFSTGYDTTNVFGRVDHAASGAHRMSARYSFYDVGSDNARSVGGLNAETRGTRLDNRDQTGALSLVSTFSNAMVSELRAQVTRSRLAAPANDVTGPAVNISGVANFGTSTTSPTARDLDVLEVSESVTVQRGNHLLKSGASVLYERLTIGFPGALQGVYSFSNLSTFLSGNYTNFQQAFGEDQQAQQNANLGFFVQDEWRLHSSLTLNAGLRYDLQFIEDPIKTDTNNLSPRIGLAFAPGNGRTVYRASGGLYYDRIPLRAVSNALQRDGVKYLVAQVTPTQSGAPVFPAVMPVFPSAILTNITTMDRDVQNGLARQFNAQVERRLLSNISVTAGYVHLTGRQIIMSRNMNAPTLTAAQAAALGIANLGRPDGRFANNGQFQSIGRSSSNAMTLSARASGGRLGTIRAAYTLSKAMDDAGNAFFSTPQDNSNVHDDWGRTDNDQRHRVMLSGSLRAALGVEFAYLYSYASAPPFNIQTGNDRNGDTNANDRPAGVGRNTGIGFDFSSVDIRVSRGFAIGRQRVEAILDVFNLTNRTNLLIPNNTFGTGATPPASFGQATVAGDPRQAQIGLRWTF